MNLDTYSWTGISALERCYRVNKAPSGTVLGKNLINYNLIVFDADGLLHECPNSDQAYFNDPDEWRLRPGVKDWFQSIDWVSPEQSPCLAFIGDDLELRPGGLNDTYEVLNAVVHLLVDGIHTSVPALVNSVTEKRGPDRALDPWPLLAAMRACRVPPSRALYSGDLHEFRDMPVDCCRPRELFGW